MAKRILPAIGLIVALTGAPAASSAKPETFVALEDLLSQALASYDRAVVDRLFDEDLVFVFPNGRVATKDDRMKGLTPPASATGALTSHNDSVEVRYKDGRMAVVLVKSSWRQDGAARGAPFVATHVWVRRGRNWRLVAAQVAQASAPAP